MDGILIIDKPAGITSHDVVARVRRILKTKRVGHTGTLDPFATGVMVILVGQATRLAQFLDKDEKEYEALVRFGFETNTGDRTGERREEATARRGDAVTKEEIENALIRFRGAIKQVPPMYSAKKVAGKKLYEHARQGETLERRPVTVNIYELEMSEPPAAAGGPAGDDFRIILRVVCSAGTYIRSLAEDIGRRVGVGAHLAELRRTRAGKFGLGPSLSLERLDSLEDKRSALIPMEHAVSHLPGFILSKERIEKTKNGLSTHVADAVFANGETVKMLDSAGQLIAVGFYSATDETVRPKVVLI
ncbi:MAG TPA: tRNA pseudouridine(55) synthase TruB [Pyrinomonadaceae bacterium]|nr:tRNA pseudouridine(55) synthase TruB [Pyrinomonadaceae bacterium]